eukprot:3275087-Pleurochrysis_carterae.AAC.2
MCMPVIVQPLVNLACINRAAASAVSGFFTAEAFVSHSSPLWQHTIRSSVDLSLTIAIPESHHQYSQAYPPGGSAHNSMQQERHSSQR